MKKYKEWSHKNVIDYYSDNRDKVEDMYKSEKEVLNIILKPGMKILDIGCAAGGYYKILKTVEPTIDYTGIDISPELIDIAKKKYPNTKFFTGNAIDLPFDNDEFDLVFSFGTFHMEPNYKKAIEEAYRVSRKYILFDLRLHLKRDEFTKQNLIFKEGDENIYTTYNILNMDDVVNFLKKFERKYVNVFGYFHEPSKTVNTKYRKISMTMFVIRKKEK